MTELMDRFTFDESIAPEFLPVLFLHLGKTRVAACYHMDPAESSLGDVVMRWREVESGLGKLIKMIRERYPESHVLLELAKLRREAMEMASFHDVGLSSQAKSLPPKPAA